MPFAKRWGFIVLLFMGQFASAQHLLFYNVENLFDTINNPSTHDEEFLPTGHKAYGSMRYYLKVRATARALRMALTLAETDGTPIELIGLCEVENAAVVQHLARHAALRELGPWEVVHFDSPDPRGIDVAALVRTDLVRIRSACPIEYSNDSLHSRDALKISLRSPTSGDSLDWQCAIVHLSSKRGGAAKSNWKRTYALSEIRNELQRTEEPAIIVGDFNDNAQAPMIGEAKNDGWFLAKWDRPLGIPVGGTYKFKGRWDQIDLALGLQIEGLHGQIIAPRAFLSEDEKWSGFKPFRTWQGSFYLGGYSDHLPIHIFLGAN